MRRILLIVFSLVVLPSCYHATIETGLAPGPQTIRDGFANAWIYGLVPPSTVETMERCPNGVARIETRLSFVNQLVNFLTLGIYTPMEIVVTCAAGQEQEDAPTVDDATSFNEAIRTGGFFYVDLN